MVKVFPYLATLVRKRGVIYRRRKLQQPNAEPVGVSHERHDGASAGKRELSQTQITDHPEVRQVREDEMRRVGERRLAITALVRTTRVSGKLSRDNGISPYQAFGDGTSIDHPEIKAFFATPGVRHRAGTAHPLRGYGVVTTSLLTRKPYETVVRTGARDDGGTPTIDATSDQPAASDHSATRDVIVARLASSETHVLSSEAGMQGSLRTPTVSGGGTTVDG